MKCWWSGDEFDNGYDVTNSSTDPRTVPFASDAIAFKGDIAWSDPSTWVSHTVAEVIADPWGSAPGGGAVDSFGIWIAVNDGEVTSLAVMWVP
jgi:hypothetical protein